MSTSKVKVCRVETLAGAKLAAAAGVDFIGLHAIDRTSFGPSEAGRFCEITRFLFNQAPNCTPVLVTRSTDAAFIADAVSEVKVSIVQLHERVPPAEILPQLARACMTRRIPVPLILKTIAMEDAGRKRVAAEVDEWVPWAWAILLDTTTSGGTGRTINWEVAADLFSRVGYGRTFLAGGISGRNAATALGSTRAWALDAQSATDIPHQKNPRFKSIVEVLSLTASTCSVDYDGLVRRYRWRRSDPRLLFSPTELSEDEFGHCSGTLVRSNLDGVQIDVADGTAGVSPWTVGASELASRCNRLMPEFPLWLHCFSRDEQWLQRTLVEVQKVNPHFVGLIVQPGLEIEASDALCNELEKCLQLPVVLSVTVGELERAGERASMLQRRRWQLTTPTDPTRRAERISRAIGMLAGGNARVQLDRAVDRPLIESLETLPHCATVGRGLLQSSESSAKWIIEKLETRA
jgi:phosphoribosylanthranilate isomerase